MPITLGLLDYRASERTFQLPTQVAGRASRADKEGEVVIQTFNPDHYYSISENQDAVLLQARNESTSYLAVCAVLLYSAD